MTISFAKKLARMPGYRSGVPAGQAPEAIAAGRVAQLASNESPFPPHEAVVEAIHRAAVSMNRYPDPEATLLRRRLAEQHGVEPERVAVGNGSCEILLAAAEALVEPGFETLYAWPSFSMYPFLPALTGAVEVRVPLAAGGVHDLDAMASSIGATTRLAIVCNPNNPTATHIPATAVGAFLERVPPDVTVILDEAYIEFQVADRPEVSLELLAKFPNLVLLRTFSKANGLAGLRIGYAIGSAQFRAAIDAVRQPFSVNAVGQAAAAAAIGRPDDVSLRVAAAAAARTRIETGVRNLGLQTTESQANFSWIDLGGVDEAAVVAGLGEREIAVRPGATLGGPGHIRVSYGTEAENERFLIALAELLA